MVARQSLDGMEASRGPAALDCCAEHRGMDLVLLLEGLLFRLARRSIRDAGLPEPGPRPSAHECAAEIGPPVGGLLALRCGPELAARICPKPGGGPRDLLHALLAELSRNCVLGGGRAWPTRLFRGGPQDWPARDPDQSRVIRVGPAAIELRFWSLYRGSRRVQA